MQPDGIITVGIVEDDEELRDGFVFLISHTAGMSVAVVCSDGEEAVAQLPKALPMVVMMDVQLPGKRDGIACIRELKQKFPQMLFVVLTVFENDEVLFSALEAGASGYILKTAPPEKIVSAIREVQEGGAPMSAQIARRVVERFRRPNPVSVPANPGAEAGLTEREQEVLALLARGHLYKEIADKLGISVDTVRKHLGRIYRKMHVQSRTEALLRYLGR